MNGAYLRGFVGATLSFSALAIGVIMTKGLGKGPNQEDFSQTETPPGIVAYTDTTTAPITDEQPPLPEAQPTDTVQVQQQGCAEGTCLFQDTCVSIPTHASCTSTDQNNARRCNDGYIEQSGTCIAAAQVQQQAQTQQQAQVQQQAQTQQLAQQQAQTQQLAQQQAQTQQLAQVKEAILAKQQASAQAQQLAQKLAAEQKRQADLLAQQQAAALEKLLAQQQTATQTQTRRRTRAS